MTGARTAYLPIAIVFGIAAIGFLAAGNSIWVAFLPIAITFLVLSRSKDDEDDDGDDLHGTPGPPPREMGPDQR
ncbi:hypothetical protein GCM10009846_28070 [Agrococcus versicolor]|uniref:DUF3099 domain-containing protein n=1 Tax=Agrococcus versicolor TaxID=501482 RepID=A0ABN3AXA5_9MICO